MEGIHPINYQPLLDGWGNSGPFYDHRFLGFDQAPYMSHYLPAQPAGPYMEPGLPEGEGREEGSESALMSDGVSSDNNANDTEEGLQIYSHVTLQKMVGKQLAVWCHRAPDTLAIFTPIPGDTLSRAVSFARSALRCDPATDRVLLLLPGHKRPLDPAQVNAAQLGTSLLVVPKNDYVVTLEVTQLKVKVQIGVNVTMTVRQVKAALQKHRGFPVERTDLLFQDRPMENHRHLFDYRIKQGSTLFVMLHLFYDVGVVVETFWGTSEELLVDPCMTTSNLLDLVLRRTISPQAGHVSTFYHLLLPRHALLLYSHQGDLMQWSACLGLYGLKDGATLSLSTVALAHRMSLQTIPVIISHDRLHNFSVSKFDYWSVLALKLHGLLGYPVNLMRLFLGKREVDLARAVGPQSAKAAVRLDMSLNKLDMDVYGGVFLTFRLGKDIVEELLVSPTRTVKAVKTMMEEIGVPNASVYNLTVDGVPLPDNGRIGNVLEEHKKPIELKLKHYPVFVHAPKNVIYKMNAHAQEAMKVFKGRVEMKTGLSQNDYYMLMAGMPVADSDSTPVFQSSLAIGSSVFLMAVQQRHVFFLLWDDWLVKLRLPFQPQPSEVRAILTKDRNIPEGSLASVGNFLQWYFEIRSTRRDLLHHYIQNTEHLLQGDDRHQQHRQSRPKKRREEEAALWRQNHRQMEELQQVLEKRYHHHHPPDDTPIHHHNHPSPVEVLGSPAKHTDQPGMYYSAYTNGGWRRVNPEDLADGYLKAWSLPADPVHKIYGSRKHRLKKSRSAMPDFRTRREGEEEEEEEEGRERRYKKRDPEWMYSLRQKAHEDRLEPAHSSTLYARKKRRRRKKALKVT